MQQQQQQHQLDEKTRLLNISYLKLQQVKFNKITKRAIETPLNQSVIVWNFLKKVENLIFETQQQQQQQIINNETSINTNPSIDWATITPPSPQLPSLSCQQLENVNTIQLMDIESNNVNNNNNSSKNNQNNKTTAIGSERKNKLLNKHNENEPPLVEQDQLTVLLKRSKFSNDDLIVSSQPVDEDMDEDITDTNTFSLWSSTLSTIQQQEQEYNYYYYYYHQQQQQQQQKSCSYEFIDHHHHHQQQLDSNIEYFDDNMIDQSSNNNIINTSSSQTSNNIEQVINILIECE
jgi:hypothetical protein